MAGPAPVGAEARWRRVSLPLVSVAPRRRGLATVIRGSATMFTDDPKERFAAGVFLYRDGELVWQAGARDLDYAHPTELVVPPASDDVPGLLYIYVTKQAYLDGVETPRVPGFEETWVFNVSADGDVAVSVPAVPFIGSRKKGIDHHYQCFAGLRLVPGRWRSTAWVINPYADPLDLRAWLQSPRSALAEIAAEPVTARSVREFDLLAAAGDPARFDYGTLIAWGSLKPQGYVAITGPDGRTRAMDHFNPFWR